MVNFVILINSFQLLTIVAKCFILDVAGSWPHLWPTEKNEAYKSNSKKLESYFVFMQSEGVSKRSSFITNALFKLHIKAPSQNLIYS